MMPPDRRRQEPGCGVTALAGLGFLVALRFIFEGLSELLHKALGLSLETAESVSMALVLIALIAGPWLWERYYRPI